MKANPHRNEKKHHWLLLLLTAICVLYGLHLRVQTVANTEVEYPFRADAGQYYMYARNLNLYGVYSHANTTATNAPPPAPDALRSPGFAWFGALFVSENNHNQSLKRTLWAQTAVQIISFMLMTWVLIRALGSLWALPGIFLLWTFPHFISINTYYLSESLFTSFLALLIWCVWHLSQIQFAKTSWIIGTGLLVGIASLVRPVLEALPIFIGVFAVIYRPGSYQKALAFIMAGIAPVILWKLRNLLVVGATSDPTLLINGIYHGSFPDFMYNGNPDSFAFPYRFDPRASEVHEGVGATLAIIWQRCTEQPLTYLHWYLLGKQTYLWQWDIVAGQGSIFIYPTIKSPFYSLPDFNVTYQINYFLHRFWIGLGLFTTVYTLIAAAWFKKTINVFWLLLALLVTYCALIHNVLAGFPRYAIPFKLALILLSLYGLREAYQWLHVRMTTRWQW